MLFIDLIRYSLGRKSTGLIPQPEDKRDYKYKKAGTTFLTVDLSDLYPEVSNQGAYNSCTAHAICEMWDYLLANKMGEVSNRWKEFKTSKAYLWYYSRLKLGTQNKNSGAFLRDCFKVLQQNGWTTLDFWDYDDGIFTEPNNTANISSDFFKLWLQDMPSYYAIPDTDPNKLELVKNALSNSTPFVFGFPVDGNFTKLNPTTNIYTKYNSAAFLGNHAMQVVGYNEDGFKVRNSWGRNWGNNGYCIIDYALFQKYSFDLWAMSR